MQQGAEAVEAFQCGNGTIIDVAGDDFDPIAAVDALLGQGAHATSKRACRSCDEVDL